MSFKRAVEPFRLTYDAITIALQVQARGMPSPQGEWIEALVTGFMQEFKGWDSNPDVAAYLLEIDAQSTSVERLALAAYLHVCYDLPRVLANYPVIGFAPFVSAYFELTPTFRAVFRESASNPKITGVWSVPARIARLVNADCVEFLTSWVLHLRTAAYLHAVALQNLPDRPMRERAMMQAMLAAVRDATSIVKKGLLDPPHSAAFRAAVPIATVSLDVWLLILGVGLVIGYIVFHYIQQRRQLRILRQSLKQLEEAQKESVQATMAAVNRMETIQADVAERAKKMVDVEREAMMALRVVTGADEVVAPLRMFVDVLGARVADYVSFAVARPSELERYVEFRRPRERQERRE